MRKPLLLSWLLVVWLPCPGQTLPFENPPVELIHFQRTNLVVRWEASQQPWSKTLWTYRVLPTHFSSSVISNVLALGPFNEGDAWRRDDDGVIFWQGYGAPSLRISYLAGAIEYDGRTNRYSASDLAKDVPGTNQLFGLITNFLPKIGITLSEVAEAENGSPKFSWPDDSTDHTLYLLGETTLTNVAYRAVSFNRALDGVEFRGNGGDCTVGFGEHGRVVQLRLHWQYVERHRAYATATPTRVVQWIREGRAIQKHMLAEHGFETVIDWPAVKSLTIRTAKAYYWGGFFPVSGGKPEWVRPIAELSGTVDTGTTSLPVEIVCPVIDDTAQALGGQGKN